MAFSSNLRYLRKKYNLSQDELAEKLGYKSFTTIQKWESGVSEPSISVVKQLSAMFNITMDELMNIDLENGEKPSGYYLDPETAAIAQEVYERPEMRMLFDASRKISPEDMDLVISMIDRLKKDESHED